MSRRPLVQSSVPYPAMAQQNKVSTLLLGHPIERSEIELGRLILHPFYPDDEFYAPKASKPPPNTSSGETDKAISTGPAMKTSIQLFGNFNDLLERARQTKLELNLLSLLSLSANFQSANDRTSIVSPLCYLHELRNPESYFREVCKEPEVREWMENAVQRPRTSVYLVCGFQTLTDAKVQQSTTNGTEFEVGGAVPVATIAAAAGGVPLVLSDGIGDIGASVGSEDKTHEELGYMAKGERVYAVMCRKVCFSRFSIRRRGPSLEREEGKNYWTSYIADRAHDPDEDDGVEAALGDSLDVDDLEEGYETFNGTGAAGEQIIFRAVTDEEEKGMH